MSRVCTFLLGVCLLAAYPVGAQRILPHSLGPWPATINPDPSGFSRLVPVATLQSVLAEYGVSATESVLYNAGAESVSDRVQATVFQMKDPSGAYGLYSFLRAPDMAPGDFSEHSSRSRDRALVLTGNLVLDVEGKDLNKLDAQIKSLLGAVSARAQDGPLPTLWQHLPRQGLIERSDRYVLGPQTLNQLFPGNLGDAIGFSKGAEAELARYHVAGREVTLLIADFPTPGFATEQLAELQKQFNVNGSKPDSGSPPLFARRNLTLLALVSGAPTKVEAEALLNQVQSGTQLTWDEPTFQFKEPSIEMMVVGAILGTGIICVFALVAGLAFGGFRLFIKRMLPGKVFDRGTQLQVLQLGLASKPINAEDFYGSVGTLAGGTPVDKNLPDRIALRIFR
ncbi:MAG TPA: DUF6599 family protein [Candidatus Acidoferrales bacterium]|nr:DUF6599 family protein [Candidatus Acidoferrales bacterium]